MHHSSRLRKADISHLFGNLSRQFSLSAIAWAVVHNFENAGQEVFL